MANSSIADTTKAYDPEKERMPNEVMPHDLESNQDSDIIEENLSRAISNPENIEQLESLVRVLSSRRGTITDSQGTLLFDPENFELGVLLKTISHQLNAQGIPSARTGVVFEDLTSVGVDIGAAYGPSMSEIFYALINIPSAIKQARNPPLRKIIRSTYGLVKSGEMLLVLGRPGSGCSTLLKTLSGEIDQLKGVEGSVTYDGVPLDEMLKTFRSEIVYNPECMSLFLFPNL